MKVQISKEFWSLARRGGRRIELVEAFIDFDPVFPGWPPNDGDQDDASRKRHEPCQCELIELRRQSARKET
jgi:hypothetical protein